MAKFQFRLQTLVKIREAERDQRRADLAQAFEAQQIIEQRITDTDEQIEGLRNDLRAGGGSGEVNVDSLMGIHRYEIILRSEKQQLVEQAGEVGEETERRRDALVEADRQVRVLEKLREKQEGRFDEEQLRLEVKIMDETAGLRASTNPFSVEFNEQ